MGVFSKLENMDVEKPNLRLISGWSKAWCKSVLLAGLVSQLSAGVPCYSRRAQACMLHCSLVDFGFRCGALITSERGRLLPTDHHAAMGKMCSIPFKIYTRCLKAIAAVCMTLRNEIM